MFRYRKFIMAGAVSLAISITAWAEPAALGNNAGTGAAPEPTAGNIACADCPAAGAALPGVSGTAAAANPVTTSNGGVTAFNNSGEAGRAIINGGDFESPQSGGKSKGPVPEPSTVALLGAGLAALVIGLRRRG